jgi:hypothetical protein
MLMITGWVALIVTMVKTTNSITIMILNTRVIMVVNKINNGTIILGLVIVVIKDIVIIAHYLSLL